jgi:transposase-like protein
VEKKGDSHPEIERWTARRKTDLVLEIIKGQKTIVDAEREYDLKQSEIQKWIETFMEYGRQGLRANPKNVESLYVEELRAHPEKIGQLVLQIDVLEKPRRFWKSPRKRTRLPNERIDGQRGQGSEPSKDSEMAGGPLVQRSIQAQKKATSLY